MSEDGNEQLPLGWEQTTLGAILPLNYGKGLTKKQRDSAGIVPVFGSSGIVGRHSQALTSGSSLIIGRKGSVGEVYYSPVPCWPIDTTYFYEETESTNLRFFNYLLKSLDLGRLDKSTTIPGLSRDDYNPMQIAIPPFSEQCRIVEEIERRFSQLDAGVAALERAKANLKNYRASVLQSACEGRLVPTEAELARTEGREYEPADQLLTRILKERRAKWEAEQLAKMEAQGKAPKDDKWKAKYKEPAGPDTSELPELPEGWVWARVEQLASFEPNAITDGPFGSNLKTAHYTSAGPRVIRLQNIGDGVFIDVATHISQEHYEILLKHRIEAGDLVIATLGEKPPRACVIPPSIGPAIVKADCIRFHPERQLASSHYLNCALNAESTRTRMETIVHGVGRPRLNLGEIKAIALPIPPMDEQLRIVAEVEDRLSILDKLEVAIMANLKRAERLRQAVLKQAFEGKLVPQDPNDEPASALLEHIREERARKAEEEKVRRKPARKKMAKTKRGLSGRSQPAGKKPLLEVLNGAAGHLTPEQLFNQSGYTPEDIEEFYEELKREVLAQRIEQERPNDAEVYLRAVGE